MITLIYQLYNTQCLKTTGMDSMFSFVYFIFRINGEKKLFFKTDS